MRAHISTSRLLRAAAELIVENGYQRATLAAVGKRAGYSRGLVTQRFGSKDGLLNALVQRMVDDWAEREVRPLLEGRSGIEAVDVVLDGIRHAAKQDPRAVKALYTLMFEGLKAEPVELNERMRALHSTQRAGFERSIALGVAEGTVRPDVEPAAVARVITSTLRGAAYQWLIDPEFPFDNTIRSLEEFLRVVLCSPLRANGQQSTGEDIPRGESLVPGGTI